MEFRELTVADLPELMELENELFQARLGKRTLFAPSLKDPSRIILESLTRD